MGESFPLFDILSGLTIALLRIILAQLKNVFQILRKDGNNATCSFDFRFSLSLSAAAPLHRSMRVMGDFCFNYSWLIVPFQLVKELDQILLQMHYLEIKKHHSLVKLWHESYSR